MNNSASKPNPETFNALVAVANIAAVNLMDVESSYDISSFDPNSELTIKINIKLEHVAQQDSGYNELDAIQGVFKYEVSCAFEDKKIAHFVARYATTYVVNATPNEDDVRHFMNRVGKHAAYPYFRALCAVMGEQAGVPLPPLPVISDQPQKIIRQA